MKTDDFGRCTRCGVHNPSTGMECLNCRKNDLLYSSGVTPYTCPTCNGTGKVSRPPWLAGDVDTWSASSVGELYKCGSCKGEGILWR